MRRILLPLILTSALGSAGCAKQIHLRALPLAQSGKAEARIELTYNRNDSIRLKLANVPDPAALHPGYTRYVVWITTPDRQHVTNAGQLRVENGQAEIQTLTPLRRFTISITAESTGDVMSPGPDVLFQSEEINW